MSEFARVLTEIIDQGKKAQKFSVKELARQSQITPSYLSNLKRSKRKPPAHKTLLKLTEALRGFHVQEGEVQRLVDAYNRQSLDRLQEPGKLLGSLIDEYKEEGNLFGRLKQGIQTKGLVLKTPACTQNHQQRRFPETTSIEGDSRTFMLQAINLLEYARELGSTGGRIYITWFHHNLVDEGFQKDRRKLRETLRSFLWADSPFRAFHLWAGDIVSEITVLVDFLVQYIGTSHCFLYEIPYSQYLSEYLLVEGVGFVEARPISENSYWIHTLRINRNDTQQVAELNAFIRYFEYILGPQEHRKPLVQTNAPPERFSITPVVKKLADVESSESRKELLHIKSSLSARYRPLEPVRAILEAAELSPDRLESYIAHHRRRALAQEKSLNGGKERCIHEKAFLIQEFQERLLNANVSGPEDVRKRESALLKGQIIGVLRALKANPQIHFALAEREFLIRFSLSGGTAFLSFEPPGIQAEPSFTRDDLLAMALTEHPGVVYQLRHEFDAIWNTVDPQWRTDTEQGRRNVIDFFITEPLKALLDANVPGWELWDFMVELVEHASYLDEESCIKALYTHEQVAQEIFILNRHLPMITMPIGIGPWESTSSLRTRQIVFQTVLQKIKRVHFVVSRQHVDAYTETGQYENTPFTREWIDEHLDHLHELMRAFPEKIILDTVPHHENFPVSIEIINHENIFLQNVDAPERGGMLLHDKGVAKKLIAYIERNYAVSQTKKL